MVVVQKIVAIDMKSKKGNIKTCLDFSKQFERRIENIIQSFHEVRIVFDFYKTPSLKASTRNKRGDVNDDTVEDSLLKMKLILRLIFCPISKQNRILPCILHKR